MIESLDSDLIAAISENRGLLDIRKILQEYKNRGIQVSEMQEFLTEFLAERRKSLQGTMDEVIEDKILEILDIVTGFCSSALKVW